MDPPLPSLTATWHRDTYPAISPSNPRNTAKGRTVVVTGAGAGIGREIARAYAEAGAEHVALLGRTQQTLNETKDILNGESPATKVTVHIADVADEEAIRGVAEELKGWDILILNAGIAGPHGPIAEAKLADWWRVYETNVRGIVNCAQRFLPTRNTSPTSRTQPSILGINAGLVQTPAGIGPSKGASAYSSSKMAQLKVMEFLAAENPDVFVASVHPGVVMTDMTRGFIEHGDKDARKGGEELPPLDDLKLPAHFMLWMTSPEAHFLRGRFVWVNWDVEQLKARAEEIQESQMLTSNVLGWPYRHE